MYRKLRIIVSLIIVGALTTPAIPQQVGLEPVPLFTEAKVQAQVSFNSATGLYTYSYTITNPPTNTGEIVDIDIDITKPADSTDLSSQGLTIQLSPIRTKTFDEKIADFKGKVVPMVPVGIRVPQGWSGILGRRGIAKFFSGDAPNIFPGETLGGFEVISRGLPAIREIDIEPAWVLLVESEEDVTPEVEQRADEIEASLPYKTKTLGPTAPPVTFYPFNFSATIKDYVNQSVALGWLMDQILTNTLLRQIDTINAYLNANDPTQAKAILRQFMAAIEQASSTQRRGEAYGLLYYNAQYMISKLGDTPPPPTPGAPPPPPLPPLMPSISLTPNEATLPIGSFHTLTATATLDDQPYDLPYIKGLITSGPNTGLFSPMQFFHTGTPGTYSFSYTSRLTGKDEIMIYAPETSPSVSPVYITWEGGPDLAIGLFIPPVIKVVKGERPVPIGEITINKGTTDALSSTTRYFLSDDPIIDPDLDSYIGERSVGPLTAGESSSSEPQEFTLPGSLPEGTYYLGACADARGIIAELNEEDNCLLSELNQIVVPVEKISNQPPDCSRATSNPNRLWPPDHKIVPIAILGVTDPDNNPISITVISISQDEPTNNLGDGDSSPDGFGVNTSMPDVRAERSGTGNGRVYAITFMAEDGKGGSCEATVNVGVPHDLRQGSLPLDDGQRYDSTGA